MNVQITTHQEGNDWHWRIVAHGEVIARSFGPALNSERAKKYAERAIKRLQNAKVTRFVVIPRQEEEAFSERPQPEKCPHGKEWGQCDACDYLSDLAYDSARERGR